MYVFVYMCNCMDFFDLRMSSGYMALAIMFYIIYSYYMLYIQN